MMRTLQICCCASLFWFLLIALYSPSIAQSGAVLAHNARSMDKPLNQSDQSSQQLVQVLDQLEKVYDIRFAFQAADVENKLVKANPSLLEATQLPLEKVLQTVLDPLDLTFKRSQVDDYYIIRKKEDQPKLVNKLQSVIPGNSVTTGMATNSAVPSLRPSYTTLVEKTITGKVTDLSTGEELPGVNILVKGTSIGTITDVEGNYRLTAPDDAQTLVFSSVGYTSEEITIGNQRVINLEMAPDIQSLSEIVVVGYGTQQKRDITGSIASISSEQLQNVPVADFSQAIAGQVAGVQVVQTTGAPGGGVSVRVRGTGSISAGNEPLYVVDGVPVNGNQSRALQGGGNFDQPINPLNTLSPNDIESLEVLKDASATAIYGSRGSNGVVLITTKRGKSGKPMVTFNMYGGVQEVEKTIDLLNEREVAEFWIEARTNSYVDQAGGDPNTPFDQRPDQYSVPPRYRNPEALGEGTNFQDEIFRVAPIQSYQASVSGGADNIQYYISGNYMNQKGIVISSGFERYSLRANIDAKVSDKIRVGLNFNPSFTNHDRVNAEGHWGGGDGAVIAAALTVVPTISPTPLSNGYYEDMNDFWANTPGVPNPVGLAQVDQRLTQSRMLSNLFANYEITEGLNLKTTIGVDVNNFSSSSFHPSFVGFDGQAPPIVPFGEEGTTEDINWISETTLDYSFTLSEKHTMTFLVGNTIQKSQLNTLTAFAESYPNDLVQTVNAGVITNVNSDISENSLLSFFGRFNYSYADKYLLSATLRADGSSRFGSNNRWGTFPSVSGGWRLSEEDFMNGLSLISDLKIKASYGITGNNAIPDYGAIGLLSPANYVFGGGLSSGLAPRNIANVNLGWERTQQTNIGVELGLADDRFFLTGEYFNSLTTDLLLQVNVPQTTGFDRALQNIGKVENTGWEFTLNSRNLVGRFKWSTNVNITFLDNKVLALGPEGDPIIADGGRPSSHITRIGDPLGSFYGYRLIGIYQSQADIDAHPENNFGDADPGDARFEDISGDGSIGPEDRTVIGSPIPDFTYGITNTLSFKNFSLNVLLQGSQGAEIMDQKVWVANTAGFGNTYQFLKERRWISTEQPGDGKTFRWMRHNSNRSKDLSTYHIHDASFLRIRTVTLNYQVPPAALKGVIRSIGTYFTIQNLHTFSNYKAGFNPEADITGGNPLTPGTDYGGYPLARTYTLGVNLSF